MARLTKLLKLLSHIFFLITINYIITRKSFNPVINKQLNRYLPDLKHILIWNKIHGIDVNGQKQFIQKNCKYINCYFTRNRSLFGDLRYFDAVVFNLQHLSRGNHRMPSVRAKHQKYIFAANDSADNYPICDPKYDGFFNWTWTYKRDSTIPYRFISVFTLDNDQLDSHFDKGKLEPIDKKMRQELAYKSKAATIFLDKCESKSGREFLVKALQTALNKYNMTIDVYGKCGTMECRKRTIKPCLMRLKKYYFFYLAFEDSLAKDFVTKTVLYAYRNNAVPIVYGKANYTRFLPPDSYLDAMAVGPTQLAQIMYQVISDQSRYRKFFNWKNYYNIRDTEVLDVCELCISLNKQGWLTEEYVYENFRNWWNEEKCNSGLIKVDVRK